jgi:hypothetical protein
MLIKLIQIKIVFTQYYDNDKAKHTNADLSNLYPFHYRAGWIQPLADLIHITIPYWCRHDAKYIIDSFRNGKRIERGFKPVLQNQSKITIDYRIELIAYN